MKNILLLVVLAILVGCDRSPNGGASDQNSAEKTSAKSSIVYGKVRVEITYQYNKSGDSRPDSESKVLLIPEGHKGRLGYIGVLESDMMGNDKIKPAGAYFVKVGGNGKGTINRVKPGKYSAILISSNTGAAFSDIESNKALLSTVIEDGDWLGMRQVYLAFVDVEPGEEVEISHDFGPSGGFRQ